MLRRTTILLLLSHVLLTCESSRSQDPIESDENAAARRQRVADRREGDHIICHRGAVGFAHENTMEAYRAAFELGADGNEIDIRMTKDGVLVCFHDDMLDGLLDAYGDVADFTWAELQKFRFRKPGRFGRYCRIPTLREVFTLHRDYAGLMHLDVKRPGLVQPISNLLDELDMWDHVVQAPGDFTDPRLKTTRGKAGMYLDRSEVDGNAITAMLRKPGERIIVESPQRVALALGRTVAAPSEKPVHNEIAIWARQSSQREDERSNEELLDLLQDAGDGNVVATGSAAESDSADRIRQRAIAADELGRRRVRTPEVYSALEARIRNRSLHRSWRYCGLDGSAALRAMIALKAPQSVDLARFCLWRDDPAVSAVKNPEYDHPRSWTDWRTKINVFSALESLPGDATEQLCRDYLALNDDTARTIGILQFESAAKTLLEICPKESTVNELFQHRLSAVRGRAILFCLAHAEHEWAKAIADRFMPESSVAATTPAASGGSHVLSGDLNRYYHHEGPLAGTLKSADPLPLFDADPNHLWNRMYSAFYIRPGNLTATTDQPPAVRFEGGDVIEFLAWGKTNYWSSDAVFNKINPLLDEFLDRDGSQLILDPLKRVVFQHDIWAPYDHLIDLNNRRIGDIATRARRDTLCMKLAKCMQYLAVPAKDLDQLPNTYTVAVKSGAFVPEHGFDASVNYLPHSLLDPSGEWIEIDFYYPKMHEDIMGRFISLHARSFFGRSHYRIFYRFPEGREQVIAYLQELEDEGIDWKKSAQFGFVRLKEDAPQIPVGTEVLLLQQMMAINDRLQPVPTNIVESVQFRAYANIDGSSEPETNTGVGMNILDYRMKRHLLFDGLKAGGLEREPESEPQYRVAIGGSKPVAPDWGYEDKTVLFQQCANCHMSPRLERLGVASIPSIVHSGGFDAGAQMGVSRPLNPDQTGLRGRRVARYKSRHESYRRLLDYLGK